MRTLKPKVLLTASISIVAIIAALQIFLLQRLYAAEEKKFHADVLKSLQQIIQLQQTGSTGQGNSIIQTEKDEYVVPGEAGSETDVIAQKISEEFAHHDVFASFAIAFYPGTSGQYSNVRSFAPVATAFAPSPQPQLPHTYPQYGSYLYLYFPGRSGFLFSKLYFPLLSGTITVLSFLILAFILFQSSRQRSLNEIQEDFVNNIVHEFKTPVAILSLSSNVLQGEGIAAQPDRLTKYAGIVKEQSDQLEQKINRILELTLSERKISRLEKEKIDMNILVQNAIGLVEPLAEEKNGVIDFLPGTRPLMINADKAYVQQAIINLLDNSLKYANDPHIQVQTTQSEKICTISVKDNGIGMEKKYFSHIFRKFYRIPTGDVHNVKGFGIGLNFVKKVVDAHHGLIEVSSVTGIGSEFKIHLPLT